MFRPTGCFGNGTERKGRLGWKGVNRTFKARGDTGQDKTCLSGKGLGASVDNGNNRGWIHVTIVIKLHQTDDRGVQPTTSFDIIQT
eukprot:scaffold2033_cov164-Amphora_coffeaeformis.AAC.12